MATGPEKRIEDKIKQELTKVGAYYVKNFASPQTSKGIPDITGVYQEKFFAIEVKRLKGGKPTPVQLKHLIQIATQGGIACISNDPLVIHKIYNPDNYKNSILCIDLKKLVQLELTANNVKKVWLNAETHSKKYNEKYSTLLIK